MRKGTAALVLRTIFEALLYKRSPHLDELKQVTRDLTFHIGIYLPGEGSDPFSIDRNISLLYRSDLNHGRRWRLCGRLRRGTRDGDAQEGREQDT
jgi:hypothetical protein